MSTGAPRVFISYSWDSSAHRDWVRQLAEQLTYAGLQVRLDQWNLVPGQSVTQFMERELRAADFCLVVCTPNYTAKSNERRGGVGYEQQIISGDLLSGMPREKFIPILRFGELSPGPNHAVPTHFAGILLIDFRDDASFREKLEELLRAIYGKPKYMPPASGVPSEWPAESPSKPVFKSTGTSEIVQAHILEWFRLDITRFTHDIFDSMGSRTRPQNIELKIDAPDFRRLVEHIEQQSRRQSDIKIVSEQRGAIAYALSREEKAMHVGAKLLVEVAASHDVTRAITCLRQFLGLSMASIAHELGVYQLRDEPLVFDGLNWFKRSSLLEVCQFFYKQPNLLEVKIASDPDSEKTEENVTVYVPLGILSNSSGRELLASVWEECRFIPRDVWLEYLVPQMAFSRTISDKNYTNFDQTHGFYGTEGVVWRGNISRIERMEGSLHVIPER